MFNFDGAPTLPSVKRLARKTRGERKLIFDAEYVMICIHLSSLGRSFAQESKWKFWTLRHPL